MSSFFDLYGAKFSKCGKYRYALWRTWDESKHHLLFIGLNPSTANATSDDPTIRRVKRFGLELGYGGVYMCNLFALISTDPNALLTHPDPIGAMNDKYISKLHSMTDKTIFAWGSFPQAKERAKEITEKYDGYALKINADGSPAHPLYLKKDLKPIPYKI